VAQSNVKLTVDGSQATRALGQVQRKTQALTGAVSTLRNAFIGIGATAVIGQTVKQATSFQKLDIRLKLLTKDTGTYAESLKLVEQAQTKFGLSSTEALDGVTGLQARLAPLGATMDDITATFNGFNTAAILSGASAQEQAGAMRQLTQALGSGVLRGDEFNSIAEQMSVIQKPIADELGITTGELRAFAAEGKITAPVVIKALKKIEKDGGKALKELMDKDPTMVFKRLRNETEELAIAVGTLLAPAVLEGANALTKLVEAVAKFATSPLGNTVAIFSALALSVKGLTVVAGLLSAATTVLAAKLSVVGISSVAATLGLSKLSTVALFATKSITALTVGVGALNIAFAAVPYVGIALAIGGITTAIIKQIKQRQKLKDLIEKGTEAEVKESLNKLILKQIELEARLEKARESNNRRAINNGQKQSVILNNQIEALIQRLHIIDKNRKKIDEENEALLKQQKFLKELKEAYKNVGDSIATNIRDNLVEAIKGTKSLGDMARSIINDLAESLIRLGVTSLLKSKGGKLFSGLSFANGGRPPVGQASLVGERGPELFIPSTSGTIIPNNQINNGGSTNIVVNVDATNSEVEGNNSQAEELGGMLAAAVQAEILAQQRPGGLLAATR
tara:strand:+ start:3039 stop:4910 length:1872 start_codon:yes stop_codon:yes gene_type:complete